MVQVIAGTTSGNILLYNLSTTSISTFSTGHTGAVNWLQRIDSDRYASASDDMTIRIWNSKTGSQIRSIPGHVGFVLCLELFDDVRLVSGSTDWSIRVWNLTDYSFINAFTNAHIIQIILSLKKLPGGLLASGSTGNGGSDGPNLKVNLNLKVDE